MKIIVQRETAVLRDIASDVPLADIATPKIKKIIHEMKIALASQEDGVAIAAPQIGYSLRIFVVSGKFLPKIGGIQAEDMVCINPIITKLSKEKKEMEEGCLSVRYLYGKVMRSTRATIVTYTLNGKKITTGASGLLAQIFQHEVDHLNGILFIDKARFLEKVIPEHIVQKQKKNQKNTNAK